ncbi:MAG: hypothetical protein ACI9QN_002175 [Arcticibacterium sp.]|jgi:hypothetical protein
MKSISPILLNPIIKLRLTVKQPTKTGINTAKHVHLISYEHDFPFYLYLQLDALFKTS